MIANTLKKNPLLPTTAGLGVGAGIAAAAGLPKATPTSLVTPKPTATPTPKPAPDGQSAIRQYLLNNGIGNDQIGYDKANNSVTVGGQSFITPATVQGGTSYATKAALDSALQGYQTRQQTSQTNSKIDSLLKAIESDIGTYKPSTFSYDPNSDPVYQAALQRAQANAGQASGNAMADLARRGILDSTITSDRLGQIQQDAYGDVTANLLPQLFQQAYTRFQDSESNRYNAYRDKQSDTASLLSNILGVSNDRQADQQQQWSNDFATKDQTFNQGMQTKQFDRGVLESDRNYNRGVLESDRNYDRGVLESDRNYDRGVLESDRNYNRGVLESDRNYGLAKDDNSRQWASYNLSKKNSQTDNKRADSNASYGRLMDIWQATGVAPTGLESYGVQQGTPYGQQQKEKAATYEDAYKDIDNSLFVQKEVNAMGQSTGRYSVTNPEGLADYIFSLDLPEAETKRLYQRYGLKWGG
ncbi:hypothetical protein [Paenibacillus kobensis]|uniref:hypothetical protein n=1 Tax=Paenibacillus kobensis TaxID=59841 RepID=UPI000FD6E868|nr:hypothetical protein [Paenibacillus kobensis]